MSRIKVEDLSVQQELSEDDIRMVTGGALYSGYPSTSLQLDEHTKWIDVLSWGSVRSTDLLR